MPVSEDLSDARAGRTIGVIRFTDAEKAARHRRRHKDRLWSAQDAYRKEHPIKYLLSMAKRRAKARGIEFNIVPADVSVPEVCPLLGLKLDSWSDNKWVKPSLDRIDNSKGYIKGNVMIVSFRANVLKNNATAEELLTLAQNLEKIEATL